MKLEFSGKILEKYSNVKFHETRSSGSRVVPCEWTERQTDRKTDRHGDSDSHFSRTRLREAKKAVCSTCNIKLWSVSFFHYCSGNTTVLYLRVVKATCHCQLYKNVHCCTTMVYGKFMSTATMYRT
jgi:hypothetical protein